MNFEEIDPVEEFFNSVIEFVESYTVWRNYKAMSEEKKAKYIEKLTLMIVFATSPRKQFNIGMDTIRLVVKDILDKKVAEMPDE
ncbi:hypothetical protein QNK12_09945 [Neobacillus cucumis]|nr:hypothetical protein QNK12_09945 [Neobacillus cucumis]